MESTNWIIATDMRRIGGMVACARKLGGDVHAVVVGSKELADSVAKAGVDKVLFFETAEGVPAEAYAGDVAAKAAEESPRFVIANDGPASRALLGRVAGAIDAAIVESAIEAEVQGSNLKVAKQAASGKAVEDREIAGAAACIYVGEDTDVVAGAAAPVEPAETNPAAATIVGTAGAGGDDLASAARIVGVGMGLQSKDDLAMVSSLAEALDAKMACTLPACEDMHWFPDTCVLGSSHHQAAPELYIAAGISGSPNHTSGVRDSKVIVAINSDPEADIFEVAKYGITGDMYKILPALTEALG